MDKQKPLIMIIEDETLLLNAINKKIQKAEMETIPCSSAEQAFKYLKSGKKLPGVIWLDYYMKDGMDGLKFLTKLKVDPRWNKIKVVVVSNIGTDEKVKNMLTLGASQYIIKAEYRLDDIIKQITKIIK